MSEPRVKARKRVSHRAQILSYLTQKEQYLAQIGYQDSCVPSHHFLYRGDSRGRAHRSARSFFLFLREAHHEIHRAYLYGEMYIEHLCDI